MSEDVQRQSGQWTTTMETEGRLKACDRPTGTDTGTGNLTGPGRGSKAAQLTYNPRPPKLRRNKSGCSVALLNSSYLSPSDFLSQVPYQTLTEASPTDKLRIQAGITNRFRAKGPLHSDLLGKAQATKAVKVCFNESLQRILTADCPVTHWSAENDLCASPTQDASCMPHLPKCYSVSKAKGSIKPVYHKKSLPEVIKPNEISCCYSRRLRDGLTPDVILESMNTLWELHSQFFSKSERLLNLLNTSDQSEYCKNKSRETRGTCQTGGLYYCGPEDTCCEYKLNNLKKCNLCKVHNKENHWTTDTIKNMKRIISLKLDVTDPLVTREGFAIALGNLYNDKPEVEVEHILGIFAAAVVLQFKRLFNKCATVMLDNINTTTVCHFHQAASKYNQEKLRQACERWLELNLIVHLRYETTLRDLQMEVLQKTLFSPRLFTFTEYHVLQTVLIWVFLQVNTEVRLMPPYDTVIAYFISLREMKVYVDKDIHLKYSGLFQTIRFHGITQNLNQNNETQHVSMKTSPEHPEVFIRLKNFHSINVKLMLTTNISLGCGKKPGQMGVNVQTPHRSMTPAYFVTDSSAQQIKELQQMDLLPQTILLQVVTNNYYALQHGGDMPYVKYFPSEAIRFGFIITEEPWYHSEIISYCGFYFELKAIQEKKSSSYSFCMQRLNHADSNIPFGITERNAFSLRQEREVKYEILVQTEINEEWQLFTTGYLCQKFGVNKMSCQSQILLVDRLTMPVYVTFALLFPAT